MFAHLDVTSSPERDTPTTEAVAHFLPELQALLARPRTAGEPLTVLLTGPAVEDLLGEVAAR